MNVQTAKLRRMTQCSTAAIAVLALMSACGSSDDTGAGKRPEDPARAALFDKAQKEGDVYVYSNLQDNVNDRVKATYAKDIGLPLTIEKLASSAIPARFESEAASGSVRADVVISADCGFVESQVDKGYVTPMKDAGVPGFDKYPADYVLGDGKTASIQNNPYGIGYNTKAVDKAEAPKDWKDLLDPKWKGKILMVGPETGAAQTQIWNYLLESQGEAYVASLAKQAAQFYPSTGPAIEALAAGEGDILIPTAGQVTGGASAAGAPVSYNQPADTTGASLCVGLSAKAPHPNAAKLFLSDLLSPAGSDAVNGVPDFFAVGPFDKGVKLPAEYKAPAEVTPALSATVAKAAGRS